MKELLIKGKGLNKQGESVYIGEVEALLPLPSSWKIFSEGTRPQAL